MIVVVLVCSWNAQQAKHRAATNICSVRPCLLLWRSRVRCGGAGVSSDFVPANGNGRRVKLAHQVGDHPDLHGQGEGSVVVLGPDSVLRFTEGEPGAVGCSSHEQQNNATTRSEMWWRRWCC
jgi:hypothetical protein